MTWTVQDLTGTEHVLSGSAPTAYFFGQEGNRHVDYQAESAETVLGEVVHREVGIFVELFAGSDDRWGVTHLTHQQDATPFAVDRCLRLRLRRRAEPARRVAHGLGPKELSV